MKRIDGKQFISRIKESLILAAERLPCDVYHALEKGAQAETHLLAKSILSDCLKNAQLAESEHIPLCQDTGTTIFFVALGDQVRFSEGTIEALLNQAVSEAYTEGYLRKSLVNDPLFDRINTQNNTPAMIHLSIVAGDKLEVDFALKGGGAENMSAVHMLTPSAGEQGVIDAVVDTVRKAGSNPCPPIVVGVGIGSNFEGCATLAKHALLREIGSVHIDARYAKLEKIILEKLNMLDIGPQGLGGKTTALAVHIEFAPCHIASMPVAVNINCHSARHGHLVF